MDLRDIFVASVAIVLGAMMLYSAILNEGWCFQMKVARVVSASQGRNRARTVVGTVGTMMMLVGLYLLLAPILLVALMQNDSRNNFSGETNQNLRTSVAN